MQEHDQLHKHADTLGGGEAAHLPVCGMNVDPASAKHKAESGGHSYYFCSQGCKTKFVSDPGRFLAAKREAPLPLPLKVDMGTIYNASGGPPARPRLLPNLRHGSRT
jgi:YHS domain-containing protein